jgi:hypothetical protein
MAGVRLLGLVESVTTAPATGRPLDPSRTTPLIAEVPVRRGASAGAGEPVFTITWPASIAPPDARPAETARTNAARSMETSRSGS